MESGTIGVVTVAYDSDDVLGPFLASLPSATSRPVSAIVVDNAPGLGSAATIAEGFQAAYLPLDENHGYGFAVNAGVAALPPSVRWVLISNPDVVLHENAIDTMLAAARAQSGVAAVGPKILNTDGSVYPSAREIPSLRNGVGHALLGGVWPTNPWSRSYRSPQGDATTSRPAGWLSGSCILVDRSVFDELHGFDTGYFMYFEDVDLGFRLAQAGYTSLYEPTAVALHTGAHSTTRSAKRMVHAHHESARRFLNARYPGPALAPVRWFLAVSLRVRELLLTPR